jgi:hypothetical protein
VTVETLPSVPVETRVDVISAGALVVWDPRLFVVVINIVLGKVVVVGGEENVGVVVVKVDGGGGMK